MPLFDFGFLNCLFAFPLVVVSSELSLTCHWLSPLELARHLFEGGSCHLHPVHLSFVLWLGCSGARTPASFPAVSRYRGVADMITRAPVPVSAVPHVGTLLQWSQGPSWPLPEEAEGMLSFPHLKVTLCARCQALGSQQERAQRLFASSHPS